uniref:Uncharacterized protein n=1 Tax=Klebsiella pneumoniae TaxID=573 RepID=A0A8B0SVN9_KLEPN|nr:hypothetical protein [Klebsiella pneumoniae]
MITIVTLVTIDILFGFIKKRWVGPNPCWMVPRLSCLITGSLY